MVHKWSEGFRAKVSADVAARRLTAIEARDTVITPQAVVADARPVRSPLHKCFEWDDTTAGPLWREEQARAMIRSIRVVKYENDGDGDGAEGNPPSEPTRCYVNVNVPEIGRCYVTTTVAASDAQLREQMVNAALQGLRAWSARYRELQELQPIVEAIHQVEEQLRGVAV